MIETRPPTAANREVLAAVLELLRPDVAAVLRLGVEEGEVFATWLLEGAEVRRELRLWIKLPGLGSFPLLQVAGEGKVEALGFEWNAALELRRAVVDAFRAVGLRPPDPMAHRRPALPRGRPSPEAPGAPAGGGPPSPGPAAPAVLATAEASMTYWRRDPAELRLVESALRLGDPVVLPPGTFIRFETFDPGEDGVLRPAGDFVGIVGDWPDRRGDNRLGSPLAVLVRAPEGGAFIVEPGEVLEVLDIPADAPPFESWERVR